MITRDQDAQDRTVESIMGWATALMIEPQDDGSLIVTIDGDAQVTIDADGGMTEDDEQIVMHAQVPLPVRTAQPQKMLAGFTPRGARMTFA